MSTYYEPGFMVWLLYHQEVASTEPRYSDIKTCIVLTLLLADLNNTTIGFSDIKNKQTQISIIGIKLFTTEIERMLIDKALWQTRHTCN